LPFNSSLEAIRLVVLMYVRFPWSLRSVDDVLCAMAGMAAAIAAAAIATVGIVIFFGISKSPDHDDFVADGCPSML